MDDDLKKNLTTNDKDINELPWVLIESYFKNQHLKQLIRHQLESYNNFISLFTQFVKVNYYCYPYK